MVLTLEFYLLFAHARAFISTVRFNPPLKGQNRAESPLYPLLNTTLPLKSVLSLNFPLS